jgi:hypothetical protein
MLTCIDTIDRQINLPMVEACCATDIRLEAISDVRFSNPLTRYIYIYIYIYIKQLILINNKQH